MDIVYVARVPTRRIMSITLSVGTRLPAYATSMGRVLLAALPDPELDARLGRMELRRLSAHTITDVATLRAVLERVRRQGWAAVDQELEEGLRSLAVPIHDASGAVVAALNVSVHASRGTMTSLRRDLLPLVLAAVAAVEADLRRSAGPDGRSLRR
jgi:IclR family pca regulon transcriptional regulator